MAIKEHEISAIQKCCRELGMKVEKSKALFEAAKKVIPGGVNSPVRASRSVGCDPLFITRAQGTTLWDADGSSYIDFVGSWGPMIAGHAHPDIVKAVKNAAELGTSFGAPTPLEVDLAEMVVEAVPSVEKVRFVSSGTEATMSAVRLARGYTGRNIIVKFDGCYHGHSDSFLVKAGSGVITLGIPGSPGVPDDIVKNTISIPYNDKQILEKTLRDHAAEIACVIVEPVAGNMGCVPPAEGFLQTLRSLTRELDIVLIFDEVITGFRLSYGGAQKYFGITPDMTTLGKIIGGGLPVGAYGGRADIMNCVAPDGPVYQAGTLSGNPLAMAAGIAALKLLQRPGFYDELEAKAEYYANGLAEISEKAGIPITINRVGSLMTAFFTETPVTDFTSAMTANTERYAQHYRNMLASGVYLAPSQFEVAFISGAHTEEQLDFVLKATESSFKKMGEI
jgi:glutamate-1-semialdehyde 2,1-aminomutase